MPRLACKDAREYRFTLGDYERREIVKPIGDILEQSNTTLKHARYLGYATLAVGSITALGAAWFIGKGISGVWDDFTGILPFEETTDPETGEVSTEWSWTGLPTGPLGEWLGFGKVL